MRNACVLFHTSAFQQVVKVVGDKLTVQVGLLKVELGRGEVEPP